MAWIRERYYKRNVRVGKRVVSEYIGAGEIAVLTARLDQLEQAERAEHRALLRQIAEMTADAPELRIFLGYVKSQVHAALESAGYHQHKRGEWRRYMAKAKQPAAIVGPQPFDEWAMATMRAMECDDPPQTARDEYRRLLNLRPKLSVINGDLSLIVRREMRRYFEAITIETIEHQAAALQKALGADGASPIEKLLIDQVLVTWHDYHAHEIAYVNKYRAGLSIEATEVYERVLASKQKRYLSAIETLARVRRLLKLPSVQVNIGAQQIIGSEIHHAT